MSLSRREAIGKILATAIVLGMPSKAIAGQSDLHPFVSGQSYYFMHDGLNHTGCNSIYINSGRHVTANTYISCEVYRPAGWLGGVVNIKNEYGASLGAITQYTTNTACVVSIY